MALLKLDTGFNLEVEIPVGSFPKRLLAWIIDGTACILYYIIVGIITAFSSSDWLIYIFVLPYIFYHLLSEILMNGASLGKYALGLRVIAEDGGTPTINQYMIRWLFRTVDSPFTYLALIGAKILPWWCFPLCFAGLACVLFTPKSQRIGDILASTILIDFRTNPNLNDTIFTEVESTYIPRYPEVMRLSDRDINTLKGILQNITSRGDMGLAMRIADRIKSKLDLQSDEDSFQFLHTLMKDYNYYTTR